MSDQIVRGYKLMRQRSDGSLGSLFIRAQNRIPLGTWLKAQTHKTPGNR